MKTLCDSSAGRWTLSSGLPIVATLLLLAALTVKADTPYTATGSVVGAPVLGIWQTNALRQVIMRGNAHLVRVDSSDLRLTGRRLIFVDGAAQADGMALVWGTSYQEVGTFDATDTFTPTGGTWENSYRGTMGTDNSLELHSVGTGWGGAIDGLQIDETMTRAPASAPIDPAIPYEYIGTLRPPPLSIDLVLDDFESPAVGWSYWGPQTRTFTRVNGQLVVSGRWPVITRSVTDSYTIGGRPTQWTVDDGQTLEARVDLVSFSDSATWATLVVGSTTGFYGLCKGHDFMALRKWSANQSNSDRAVTLFTYENMTSHPSASPAPCRSRGRHRPA
ncbi:MAG: hypothetical protein FJ387_02095 [Verrucomicrobia bacterium]|nr:hypothetical protein [Verrucomicrobiota bacterium]